jgi:hypothetical protein
LQRVDQCDVVHAVFQHGTVTGTAGGTSRGVLIVCFVVEKTDQKTSVSIRPWVKDRKQKKTQRMDTSNIKTPTRGYTFFPHLREYWSMGQRSKTKKNTTHEHVKHQNTDTGIHILSTSPVCPCC